jgi:ubiquinone/menaquinone biosynthesis C-methylase UbiE
MQKDFEYYLENNRARAFVRELMEVRPLRRATDVDGIGRALQIACGVGSSSSQLMRLFAPRRLTAIEREPELVEIARSTHDPERFDFHVGDVFSMEFGDGAFDAVFNLADLHNYADWRKGLREILRVLKPGGLLIMEDMSRESFGYAAGRVFRRLTAHPYGEMLAMEEFRLFAVGSGLEVLRFEEVNALRLLKYFIMIARKK